MTTDSSCLRDPQLLRNYVTYGKLLEERRCQREEKLDYSGIYSSGNMMEKFEAGWSTCDMKGVSGSWSGPGLGTDFDVSVGEEVQVMVQVGR